MSRSASPYHYPPHPLLKWIVIVLSITVIVLYTYTYIWSIATRYLSFEIKHETQKLAYSIGMPIQFESFSLIPFGIRVEDVRIGEENPIVIGTVDVSLEVNPFSKDFGKPNSISIKSVKVKFPIQSLSELKDFDKKFDPKSGKNLDPLNSRSGESIQTDILDQIDKKFIKIFKSLPSNSIEITGGGLILLSNTGHQLLALRGLSLKFLKKDRRVAFKIERIRKATGPLDAHLYGYIDSNPKNKGNYRFFLKRKVNLTSNRNLWSFGGHISKDFSNFTVTGDMKSIPTFMGDSLDFLFGKYPKIDLKMKISGVLAEQSKRTTKDAQSSSLFDQFRMWKINSQVFSNQTYLNSPVISTKPIGPLLGSIHWNNLLDLKQQSITIPDGVIRFFSASDKKQELRINFKGSSTYLTDESTLIEQKPRLKADFELSIQNESCKAFVEGLPAGFAPSLNAFDVSGQISGKLQVILDTSNHAQTQLQLIDPHWGCKVTNVTPEYAQETLEGGFEVTSEEDSKFQNSTRTIKLSSEDPYFTPISRLSKRVIEAFVTSEDSSFFSHEGIEMQAIIGAFRKNLAEGKISVGGSTITMQTAKNLFLSHERTLSRKFQEIFLAWHLEQSLSKERILELYLNAIKFGPRLYGIGYASRHFFGKSPSDLNLWEAAYLASVLPNPKKRYLSFCTGRLTQGMSTIMNSLVRRMLNQGKIEFSDYHTAVANGLKFQSSTRSSDPECLERTALGKEEGRDHPL